MKFMYTNVELNLPHHLNYVAALPCKCTQRIVHVKLRVKKSVPETPKIRPTRVFVLKTRVAAKSGYGGKFYSTFWRIYLLSDMPKKY